MESKYDITPLGLLNNAKVWYFLYRQNIYLETNHKIIAIYCLLIGLEILLKSYLSFLNKEKYSYESSLKSLGHKFDKLLEALRCEKEAKLLNKIRQIIVKYNLQSIDTNDLRYPKKGDKVILFSEYFKPTNEFDILFDSISGEIQMGISDKFYVDKN